jgi:hypothetical protein
MWVDRMWIGFGRVEQPEEVNWRYDADMADCEAPGIYPCFLASLFLWIGD